MDGSRETMTSFRVVGKQAPWNLGEFNSLFSLKLQKFLGRSSSNLTYFWVVDTQRNQPLGGVEGKERISGIKHFFQFFFFRK